MSLFHRHRTLAPSPPSSAPCALHKTHRPAALTGELHHVIPRAWQAAFSPSYAPFPGSYAGQPLWDSRTVAVAPTCHRNVHFWIVQLMRSIDQLRKASPQLSDQLLLAAAVKALSAQAQKDPQVSWAAQAPARFIAVGGSLAALAAAGEWGYA